MARVRIHREDQLEWVVARNNPRHGDDLRKFGDGELSSKVRIREMGSETEPQLIEIRYEPNALIQLHAHDEDEIIYVREGELHFGTQVLRAGTSLFISGQTLYSFKAGPEGLQILNFRPRNDLTFITREEYAGRFSKAE